MNTKRPRPPSELPAIVARLTARVEELTKRLDAFEAQAAPQGDEMVSMGDAFERFAWIPRKPGTTRASGKKRMERWALRGIVGASGATVILRTAKVGRFQLTCERWLREFYENVSSQLHWEDDASEATGDGATARDAIESLSQNFKIGARCAG